MGHCLIDSPIRDLVTIKMKCIVCEKEVEKLNKDDAHDENGCPIDMHGRIVLPEEDNWDDGCVNTFQCGYGSQHDLREYLVCICDDCLTSKLEKGVIELSKRKPLEERWNDRFEYGYLS